MHSVISSIFWVCLTCSNKARFKQSSWRQCEAGLTGPTLPVGNRGSAGETCGFHGMLKVDVGLGATS